MSYPLRKISLDFTEQELLKFVNKTSTCWLWTRSLSDGYGLIRIGDVTISIHRYMYTLYHNMIIPDGLLVCHTCDIRHCVKKEHLFLGTYKDNSDDKWLKGRGNPAKGERNRHAVLTENDVREIRKIGHSVPYKDTALIYGVTPEMISYVVRRKNWTHLE